nr:GDP-mannose 4,6-dehydratase [Biomaibacter acetigenes]
MLLDASRKYGVKKYLQISTDEVYGSLDETGYFTEDTPLSPTAHILQARLLPIC